ncbi:MAG: diacylglycerol/polyprenol kinase family protein [Alphaproteobacteria bacterium]
MIKSQVFLSDKKYKKEIYRKLLHLSSLWIPFFIYFANQIIVIATLSVLLIGNIAIEYSNYKRQGIIRKYLGYFICKLSRSFELKKCNIRFSGSVFVLLASLLSVILFTKEIAAFSVYIMLISDTAAALFGKAFGKTKIYDKKSLEGSLAFFTSAIISSMFLDKLIPFSYSVILACLLATILEIYSKKLKLDDNLSVTLTVGIILTLL